MAAVDWYISAGRGSRGMQKFIIFVCGDNPLLSALHGAHAYGVKSVWHAMVSIIVVVHAVYSLDGSVVF